MSGERPITEDDLHGYVDGSLDPQRRDEVTHYLERQPEVAARVAGFARQRAALRETFGPIADEPIPAELSVGARIAALRQPWRGRTAAAAVLLLLAGAAAGWTLRGLSYPDGLATLAQEAANSYAVFAADHVHPVELRAADQIQLVNWLSNRLHRQIAVPDLAAAGFRFMGGRLVATQDGPAGFLMYDDDHGTRLVMLMQPMPAETVPMTLHSYGQVAGYAWGTKGIGYTLVGATATATLHPLADEMRRQLSADS